MKKNKTPNFKSNPPASSASGTKPHVGGSSNFPLRKLRDELKLTQTDFAIKTGISRARMQRLEAKSSKLLTIDELFFIAQGLGISPEDLLRIICAGEYEMPFTRTVLKKPAYWIEWAEGVRLGVCVKDQPGCFVGVLLIDPQKTVPKERCLKSLFVYCYVTEGSVLMMTAASEHLFRPCEGFYIHNRHTYELYNSHQFNKAEMLIMTSPSVF